MKLEAFGKILIVARSRAPSRSVSAGGDNNAVISFDGNTVVYSERGVEAWRLLLSKIAIIGEYTTANGPYIDDYFLVFVVAPKRHHFHASFYAEGRDALLAGLRTRLGTEVRCGLTNSTKLTSRCMWPPQLVGQPLFRFTKLPAGGGWNKVRRMLSPEYAFDFTTEVEAYLAP